MAPAPVRCTSSASGGDASDRGSRRQPPVQHPRVRPHRIREDEDVGGRRPAVEVALGDESLAYLHPGASLQSGQVGRVVGLAYHEELGARAPPRSPAARPAPATRCPCSAGPGRAAAPSGRRRVRGPSWPGREGPPARRAPGPPARHGREPPGRWPPRSAGLLAMDDERVGGPPAPRLVRGGSCPAFERNGVVDGEDDRHPARDPGQHQRVEAGNHLGLGVDDRGVGPGDGPGEGQHRRSELAQAQRVQTGLAQPVDLGAPSPAAQHEVGIAHAGRRGQRDVGVLSLERRAQAAGVAGDARRGPTRRRAAPAGRPPIASRGAAGCRDRKVSCPRVPVERSLVSGAVLRSSPGRSGDPRQFSLGEARRRT